jgi:ferredoxin
MKVILDYDACEGCGSCAEVCPAVFELRDDGKAYVISDKYDACDIEEAVGICPVEAISIEK